MELDDELIIIDESELLDRLLSVDEKLDEGTIELVLDEEFVEITIELALDKELLVEDVTELLD